MGIGHDIWNGLTGQTDFRAQAPTFDMQAYANAIRQAQMQALGGTAQGNATAAQQQMLADALRAQMLGQGPSLAQMQLNAARDQNARMAAGAIASQRGVNPALGARLIANQQASMNQQAAGQSAMIRAQEQLSAQQQLAGVLGQQRGQDIGQQQANTALFGTAAQANQSQNALASGNQLGADQINAGIESQNAQGQQRLAGGVASGLASAGQAAAGLARGGAVPGRAPVPGDSPRNDTVPARLSPGEIVLPRSVAQAEDAPERAAAFVKALRERDAKRGGGSPALAEIRRIRQDLAALEKRLGGGK